MDDDAAERLTRANRLTIPAVLVTQGQDAVRALLDSGVLDPVAIPFALDQGSMTNGATLGDGITPNVPAILDVGDTGGQVPAESSAAASVGPDGSIGTATSAVTQTTTAPAAYGVTPMAPIRLRRS